MNHSWLPIVVSLALMAMSIVATGYSVWLFMRRQSTPGPQKSRQVARIALGPMIVGIIIMLYLGQVRPGMQTMSLLMCLPLTVVALRFAWMIFHEPTEADAIENFAHDRDHCGKCGYSVVGNATGMCPECGWTYPTGDLPAEEADWSAWWRKWRIHYLRHCVWHLCSYIGLGSFCLAMAVVFWSKDSLVAAVVMALLGIHLCINAIRVLDYLRRRKAS